MPFLNKKYLEYLPSKKFALFSLVIGVLGIIFILSYLFFSSKSNFVSSLKKESGLQTRNLTIGNIVQQDSDGDGVQDWEETLWGTDKNNKNSFDGISDLVYINSKKDDLNIDRTVKTDNNLTETEKFAKEFFASFVAMKASGNMDPNTINDFSTALGEKITYPSLVNTYLSSKAKISPDNTPEDLVDYYSTIKKLFDSYKLKGIGDELSLMSDVLTYPNATDSKNTNLLNVSNAYQEFAKKAMNISVPEGLIDFHLDIVNSSNNIGISIINMAKLSVDPIIGVSGLSQYQKYSEDLISAVERLELKLEK